MSKLVSHDCLAPRPGYGCLMIKLATPDRIVCQTSETGIKLCVSTVHCGSGEELNRVELNLKGPIALYFVASGKETLNGWFYVLQWAQRLERYACSCRENKLHGHCCHAEELTETATASPEKIAAVA